MDKFEQIVELYNSEFEKHGDTAAAILSPKGRQHLRFQAIDPFIGTKKFSLLDYGCGLGHLWEYLNSKDADANYYGVDIVPSFIRSNKEKFGSAATFELVKPEQELTGIYDIVFASGVFNMKTSDDEFRSRKYCFDKIIKLYELSKDVLICDFATSYVDYQQENAQHFDCGEIARFCAENLSRKFLIRHDFMPYEFTLFAFKNDEIIRPQNIFAQKSFE